jgi:hypothetical protein
MYRRACLRAAPAWRVAQLQPLSLVSPLHVSLPRQSFALRCVATTSPSSALAAASPPPPPQSPPPQSPPPQSPPPQSPPPQLPPHSPPPPPPPPRPDHARDNAGKIIKTLLAYVWPAAQPAIRARVLASLALLVGAKAVGLAAPFLFKEVCDALDASRLLLVDAAPANAALVLPLAALLGCACDG